MYFNQTLLLHSFQQNSSSFYVVQDALSHCSVDNTSNSLTWDIITESSQLGK